MPDKEPANGGIHKCRHCGADFVKRTSNKVYCGQDCSREHHRQQYQSRRASGVCTACGVAPARPGRTTCETCVCPSPRLDNATQSRNAFIRPTWSSGEEKGEKERRDTKGRYVYAWFEGDAQLPFYIGKGVGDRAWKRHWQAFCGSKRSSFSQLVRVTAENFRVVIVRDNLTDEGAMLVEAALIAFVQKAGGLLANQADGMRRQEKPPLTLGDV
jgi:hypothetical protein